MITSLAQLLSELDSKTLVEFRHPNVELKQNWSQDNGKKISSNANKIQLEVAWLVVGVTDKGGILANTAQWAEKTELEISNHLNQYLEPLQACQSLECHETRSGWIIVLKISNPGVVVRWNNAAYKSVGTSLATMEPDEILGLTVSLPGLRDYSAQRAVTTLVPEAVKSFAARVAQRSKNAVHSALANLDPESALARLGISNTNAVRLLFGNATFRIVVYDAAGAPILNETRKPLYTLLQPTLYEEIELLASGVRGYRRMFPAKAFQEAVANALAHAAYFETDGEIMLELSRSRLCVSNLCTRESTYFANRWFSRSHKTVNALLMETLRLAGHVDELGRGKNLIFSEYIAHGCEAPTVAIERAGRYDRWRLILPTANANERHLQLLSALRERYQDEHKALIALALVLWRHKPVEEIRNYVDGESSPTFVEVLADIGGATFFSQRHDRIILNRWARLLIQEGVQSKSFSEDEEEHLYDLTYGLQTQFHRGYIKPKDIREHGELGNAAGAHSLSCKVLKKWAKENKVKQIATGKYQFVTREKSPDLSSPIKTLFPPTEPPIISNVLPN